MPRASGLDVQGSMVLGGVSLVVSDGAERERGYAESAPGFGAVFEAHRHAALRLAYVLTGNAAEAEDVVAEAFARMYPHFAKGAVSDPGPYLRRTVVNVVRGRFRRLATRRRYEAQARAEELSVRSDEHDVVERDALQAALASLAPRQRAAVVLRVMEDLSEAETAELLGISVGSVKAYVSRGLERLREVVDTETVQ